MNYVGERERKVLELQRTAYYFILLLMTIDEVKLRNRRPFIFLLSN